MIKQDYRLTLQNRLKQIPHASDEEIRRIIAIGDADPRLNMVRDVVRVIANLGLHNSELAALRVTDIDFEGEWIFVGRDRKALCAQRVLPLRPRVKEALISLRAKYPESAFVLGNNPLGRISAVVQKLKEICPALLKGRLTMYPVRMNFVHRLYSSGIPLSTVKCCLGMCDQSQLLSHLPLSIEVKREILRRDLENFLLEI